MTRKAQLPDGTILEFEEGTPDEVMDRVVKSHLGLNAGDQTGAQPKPEPTMADKRKSYEGEVAAYMKKAIAEKNFDPANLQALAAKYGMSVANIPQIKEFYEKKGMLNPRVAYQDVNVPISPNVEPLTEMKSVGDAGNRLRAFGKGALFDFADEAEAAARMLASGELSADEYYKIKSQINYDYDKWAKENPEEALGFELAGGLAGTFIPGAAVVGRGYQAATGIGKIGSAALRSGAVGASSGVLSGIGAADTMGDIPSEAFEQGVIGGGLSTILPGAGRFAMRGKDAILRRLGKAGGAPDRVTVAAAEQIQRAMGDRSPESVARIMKLGEAYNVPIELGIATPELSRLTKAVVSKPSEGREALIKTFAQRQRDASQRYTNQIREAFAGSDDFFTKQDEITENLRKIGDNEYQAAFDVGQVKDATIQNILKSPGLESIFKEAKEIADLSAANAASRGEDPSKYVLKMGMEPVLDASGTLIGLRPTGDFIPDVRSLNYVKRALDDQITQLFKAKNTQKASELKGLRDNMVRRLDELVPEYKEARRLYAGDLEVRDALDDGRDALSTGVRFQEVKKKFDKMSEAEKQAYRSGLLQSILQPVQNIKAPRNFAEQMLSENNIEKLRTVLPKEEFRVLNSALKREAELFRRTSNVLGGSPTTPLAQDIAKIDTAIEAGDYDTVVSLVTNPTAPGTLARVGISLASKMFKSGMGDKVYTKLAQALRTSDPEKLRGLLDEFRSAQAIAQRNIRVEDAMTGRGAVTVGAGAPSVLEERSSEMPPSVTIAEPEEEPAEPPAEQPSAGLATALPTEAAEEGNVPFSDGKASVAERNNNPGNLIVSSWTKTLPGYIGPGEGKNEQGISFAKFDTMQAGQDAKLRLVVNKINKGYRTPRALVESWLSPTNARANPEVFRNYVKHVSERVGIGPNEEIKQGDIQRAAQAIYEFESGDRP